jgi:uncharacterized protein YndB with AHSA1/START domain
MCNLKVARCEEPRVNERTRTKPEEPNPRPADGERRVEREALLDAEAAEVWEAVTDESRLEEWLAEEVELDLVEGGAASFRFDDGERRGTVEAVEEGRRLAFTWARPGEGSSRVEFVVEALPAGTRLVVTESSPAATSSAAGPVAGGLGASAWETKLFALIDLLSLVLVA